MGRIRESNERFSAGMRRGLRPQGEGGPAEGVVEEGIGE